MFPSHSAVLADSHFLSTYNSGRFRMQGRGSLAGMMPYVSSACALLKMTIDSHGIVGRREQHCA